MFSFSLTLHFPLIRIYLRSLQCYSPPEEKTQGLPLNSRVQILEMMHPGLHVAFDGEDHSTDILSGTPSNLQKHTALHKDLVCFAGLSGCGNIPYNQTLVVPNLVDEEQREDIIFSVEEIEI